MKIQDKDDLLFELPTLETLDRWRRTLEEMQVSGSWNHDACQEMLDSIDGEMAVRMRGGAR